MSNREFVSGTVEDIESFLTAPEEIVEEKPEIERIIRFGPGIGLNIRASYVKRYNKVVPNCWLHRLMPDGTSKALLFYPIVPSNYSSFYGGHNETAFRKIFAKVWQELEAQKWAELRGDDSESATVEETVTSDEEVPY